MAEFLKFLGLFIFFFVVLVLIVMGPTIYTNLSYSLGGNKPNDKYGLPADVNSSQNSNIGDLSNFFNANQTVVTEDKIVIPKINVDAPLVDIKDYSNASILEGIKHGIGHYPGTAEPGRVGNAFYTAHSSYYWWSDGKYNQVFALLHNVSTGDLIYVYYKGGKYVYQVTDKIVVNPSDVHVLDQTDEPILSLMTCTPTGTNLRRLIVHAKLIGSPSVSGSDFGAIQSIPKLPSILPLY
jgi:LPXTG-site transpeptidase (sortase) family protein